MGQAGDVKTTWNKANADEVASARKVFEEMRSKGYFAFNVTRTGDKGEQITAFDPNAELLIMAPPMRGGGA
jgi:hypothetical protein